MLIKYFDNPNLAYTTRKRYRNITLEPFAQEEQRSVLLGDGATTTIKTSKDNICNYVIIDDTRWFVTSYVYLNGKQVQLNLQRDVVGEFGISNVFGKIERGYTNGILKYRKELSLNQVLKKRIHVIPNTNTYGNYSVNSHEQEIWGLLYLTKPTNGEDTKTINIPAFAPNVVDDPFIENNTRYNVSEEFNCYLDFIISVKAQGGSTYYSRRARINFNSFSNGFYGYEIIISSNNSGYSGFNVNITDRDEEYISNNIENICRTIAFNVADIVVNNRTDPLVNGINLPIPVNIDTDIPYNYNNIVIEHNDKYIKYTISETSYNNNGSFNGNKFFNSAASALSNTSHDDYGVSFTIGVVSWSASNTDHSERLSNIVYAQVLTYSELNNAEQGNLVLNFNQDVVNEPFFILAFPLYTVTITRNEKSYVINKENAFNIFNTVIQYLSGESGYLVDAQIYPYCPQLTEVASELNGYPFFNIAASNYEYDCPVNLYPYTDVKKEYIKREYSIIAPDQSAKFDFNFYDYVNSFSDNNGTNLAKMTIRVKTALKPFSVVCSAVILPTSNSLKGIQYNSDLRGCKPSGGGFECSLASNEYQTYLRNNSNYQQIFAKQQESLAKQHEVEHNNEIASAVVNSVSATMMGAIGGGAMADLGILGNSFGAKAGGAAGGAAIAGGVVTGMMSWQVAQNDELRKYEYNLQQEMFDLQIGTIKNLPNSINRISSFNEIVLRDFWFIIETYECTEEESIIVDSYLNSYSYLIGIYDYISNYVNEGWFIRAKVISSSYAVNLSVIADTELKGGIYIYEQV